MSEAIAGPACAETLVQRYCDVRARTERIAEPLSAEDRTVQSMPDASPTKWHRAHVTWFFETFVLGPHVEDHEPFHSRYGFLFNSYYEAIGERHPRPDRGLVTRPGAAEVGRYRGAVDRQFRQLVDQADGAMLDRLAPLIDLGTHHEEQHQELMLMDIKHVLSHNPMEPAYLPRHSGVQEDPGPVGWVDVEGGVVPIGRPGDTAGFGFDNEGPRHEALLHPHRLADRLATCGEWMEFMTDGGYFHPHTRWRWAEREMIEDIRRTFTSHPKVLRPKWLNDDRGSQLFHEITGLDEYYPTEAERLLLIDHAAEIARHTRADTIVELGSGTSDKTRTLLDAFWDEGSLRTMAPMDVSEQTLVDAAEMLAERYPGLSVHAVLGDFTRHLPHLPRGDRRMLAFLMRLRAAEPMNVRISALDLETTFTEGEELRVEISTKFRIEWLADELEEAGFVLDRTWRSAASPDGPVKDGDFGLILARGA